MTLRMQTDRTKGKHEKRWKNLKFDMFSISPRFLFCLFFKNPIQDHFIEICKVKIRTQNILANHSLSKFKICLIKYSYSVKSLDLLFLAQFL